MYVLPLERKDLFALCHEKNIFLPGLLDDYHINADLVDWLSYYGRLSLSHDISVRE